MTDLKHQVRAYAAALLRRRWLALTVAWLLCAIGWTVVTLLPNVYESKARIYVDTDSIINEVIRGVAIQQNLNQQIDFMQRTLLSGPNLERVARMADLDLAATTPEAMSKVVAGLAEDVVITAQAPKLFQVTYESPDPQQAKDVVQALLTVFVESNLGASRSDMDQTLRFIEDQIALYEAQLTEAERRLADFKRENAELLPYSGSFGQNLDAARDEVRRLEYELGDARQRKAALEEQLALTPPLLEVASAPTIVGGGGASLTRQRIVQLETQLSELLLQYTDRHPDISATRRTLEQLRTLPDANVVGGGPQVQTVATTVPNALYEQIQLRIVDAQAELTRVERRLQEARLDLQRREMRAQSVPEVEAQLANLNRDYEVIQSKYEQMLARREAARVSQEVDAQANAVQFRIVDPPQTPLTPSGPNRPLFMVGVLLAALGAGVGAALLLAQLDDSFQSVQQLRNAFALPVLGGVALTMTPQRRRRRRLATAGFAMASFALIATFGALVLFNLQTFETLA